MRAVWRGIKAEKKGDIAKSAAIGVYIESLGKQSQALKKMKNSDVTFYIRKHPSSAAMNPDQAGSARVNQWSRKSRKGDGRVDIMYRPGTAHSGIAYGAAIAEQFLNGDWSFITTEGKWSMDYGVVSDQQDLKDALEASYNTLIKIKDLKKMEGQDILDIFSYNKDYATRVSQTATELSSEPINLDSDIESSKDDFDRAAWASYGKQSYRQQYIESEGLGFGLWNVFYDEQQDDPWVFPREQGEKGGYLNKKTQREKEGQKQVWEQE